MTFVNNAIMCPHRFSPQTGGDAHSHGPSHCLSTQIVFNMISEMKGFYDMLRRSDQLILDKFFEANLNHRTASGNADSLLPKEIMPFVILWKSIKELTR